jgi:hypothetical protein
MSRRPATFRQRDLTAALRGAIAAGCVVARVEVDRDGKIIVIVQDGKERPGGKIGCGNEWDVILK